MISNGGATASASDVVIFVGALWPRNKDLASAIALLSSSRDVARLLELHFVDVLKAIA